MYESDEDDVLAIRGELWMCADSQRTYKVGAGRGSKNYVSIEDDHFFVYSTRSVQSRLIKEVAFRSMRRIAWFVHNPKPPVSGGPDGAPIAHFRGARGASAAIPPPPRYFYMVLEFIRDTNVAEVEQLAKRERVVLCTENEQDFQIWQQFVEAYKCAPERQFAEMIKGRAMGGKDKAQVVYDHDETTSEEADDKVAELMCGLQLWRQRCIELLNETTKLAKARVESEEASPVSVDHMDNKAWKAHVDSLISSLKNTSSTVPPPQSSFSPSSEAKEGMNESSLRLVTLWNDLYEKHFPNSKSPRVLEGDLGQIEQQQRRHLKHIDDALVKSKIPSTTGEHSSKSTYPDTASAAAVGDGNNDYKDLQEVCMSIVNDYESKKGEMEVKGDIEGQEDDSIVVLQNKVEYLYATLREKVAQLSKKDDESDDMLAKLRAARQALDAGATCPQATLHQIRQTKGIERVAKEALISFTEATVDLFQICYDEYASLLDHVLSALHGSKVGGDKHLINSAHYDVVKVLEEERRAAKSKQEALENLMEELQRVRRERDEEIRALQQNFSRAKDGWGNDIAVLQAKLTTLQSTMTRTAVVVPAENITLESPRQELYGDNEAVAAAAATSTSEYETSKNTDDAEESIIRWAKQLVCNGEDLPGSVIAMRLQRFFFWALKSVVPLCAGRDTNCIIELVMWAMRNHLTFLQTAARVFGSQAIDAGNKEGTDLCTSLQALHDNHVQLEQLIKQYAGVTCPTNIARDADFTEVQEGLRSLYENDMLLQNIHTILETNNQNIEEYVLQLLRSKEQLEAISKITGNPDDLVETIINKNNELQQLQSTLQQLLHSEQDNQATTEELLMQIPTLYETQNALEHTKNILIQTAQLADATALQHNLQRDEFMERMEITRYYYQQYPLQFNPTSSINNTIIDRMLNTTPETTINGISNILQKINHYESLLGHDEFDSTSLLQQRDNNRSTRAQCLQAIEAALTSLGAEDSGEPAAAAIMRAAEMAKAREEDLSGQLNEAAERAQALEAKLGEMARAVDTLQQAMDGGALAVHDEEDATVTGDRVVEALRRLRDGAATSSSMLDGAMQDEDSDAKPLLPQCRRTANEMEALRASEQRYRALVGEDVGGQREGASEDPSTRAQCLHGIEAALASLGAEDSGEPAAAAIMRAAEMAKAREEDLSGQLNEAAERAQALEAKLGEMARAVDTLQQAMDGGALAVHDEEDATVTGDRVVEALRRLRDGAATSSSMLDGAMQDEDSDAKPLLPQCRRTANEMEALRASEQRYRALVGEDVGGQREGASEDPSTRAQCLHGIEAALASLGAEDSGEPAAAAIMRAAEMAKAREEDLSGQLNEAAERAQALEAKLGEMARAVDTLQQAMDGGALAVHDEEDATVTGDRVVEALRRLRDGAATSSSMLDGAMQDEDSDAKPLLPQCRRTANEMEALRASEQRYRALVGEDVGGQREGASEDPSTRAQCLHGIEAALASLGAEDNGEPAAAAIMRAAEMAKAREEDLSGQLNEAAERAQALEAKLGEMARAVDTLQQAMDGGALAVHDEEDATVTGDRVVEALRRLRDGAATSSSMLDGAMQDEDSDAKPLLPQCRRTANEMEALRASEQRYRALVGEDVGGQREGASEDPSTRAQCLHGIEAALASLGAEDNGEPAAAAIMRAAEMAKAREEDLSGQLNEAAERAQALEAKLGEMARAVDTLQQAMDGGALAVHDEEDATVTGDRVVEALRRLRDGAATSSSMLDGAMQDEDSDAKPLLPQCRRTANEMEALRASEQRYRALVGEDVGGQREGASEDPSTRAQCLHGIEAALASLGAEDSGEPAAAAIMRAAEMAKAREEDLSGQLNEAAERAQALEAKLGEMARAVDTLQQAMDGGALAVHDEEDATVTGDRVVEALRRLRDGAATSSSMLDGAMQDEDSDAKPLLPQCRRTANEMEALRASEQRYRALVGEDVGGQREGASEDPSTRAQCLHGIEAALASLGAEDSGEPAAAAIMRAAEMAKAREEDLSGQLNEAAERAQALEAKLGEMARAVDTLQQAMDGGALAVHDEEDATVTGDRVVEALRRLRDGAATSSSMLDGAMQDEDSDAKPLLPQCRRTANEMEALRASEQRYRALVGEDVGGQREGASEDPSTRAQCLHGIEAALASLGAEDSGEPAAAAIMRAAEMAKAREEDLSGQLNEAAERAQALEAKLGEMARAVDTLQQAMDGGALAVHDEEDATVTGDRVVEALRRLRDGAATSSSMLDGAMQDEDSDAKPLLPQCRRTANEMEALRASEQRYRALVGEDVGGQREGASEDPSTRAQCLHGIEAALASLGAEDSGEPAAAAIMRAAEMAKAREEDLSGQLNEAAERAQALEAKLGEMARAVDTLQQAMDGGALAVHDEEDATVTGDRVVEALRRLRDGAATSSSMLDGAMQDEDSDAKPLLPQCRRTANEMEALRASEQRYRALVGEDVGGQREGASEDPSTRAQCLHGIEAALASLGAEDSGEPAAAAIMRAAEMAKAREEDLSGQLNEAAERAQALEAKLGEMARAVDTLQQAMDGGALAVHDEEDATVTGDRVVEALRRLRDGAATSSSMLDGAMQDEDSDAKPLLPQCRRTANEMEALRASEQRYRALVGEDVGGQREGASEDPSTRAQCLHGIEAALASLGAEDSGEPAAAAIMRAAEMAKAREEDLSGQLNEAAERAQALEAKLGEMARAVDTLQQAMDGGALAVHDEEDATVTGDRVVEALRRLRDGAATSSSMLDGAMQDEDSDAKPLLPQCRRTANEMEALRASEQRYRALVGEDVGGQREGASEDPSTRAQCLHGIEAALASLGAEDSGEPAAAAIMRAAEMAKAREEDLSGQLNEAAERAQALEAKLGEMARAVDTLQQAMDGGALAVHDEEDATVTGDRVVEALRRLRDGAATSSSMLDGAMQDEDSDAKPLLPQCRRTANEMEALRASEQRYRALVGEDVGGQREGASEDPSTRAQCLHGIEAALASLGAEDSGEPAAAAIMRAAEMAKAREEDLSGQLNEAAERAQALEAKLGEMARAVDTLQQAMDGGALAVHDEEDATVTGDRVVEALRRLRDGAATSSSMLDGAMQDEDSDAKPLLPQCRRTANEMEALRASEQRYRALVGEDVGGQREGASEDPSTRAQCLHGIEAALASLGAEDSGEPAAAAIMRAAEMAKAREEDLSGQLNEAAERAQALEAKLGEMARAVDTLQQAMDGGALAVHDEEDATVTGDRVVEALRRLRDGAATSSSMLDGAMQDEDSDAKPLLPQCRRTANEMEALRASEQRYRVFVREKEAVCNVLQLNLVEAEERLAAMADCFVLPGSVLREMRCLFMALLRICSLLKCSMGSAVSSVEELLEDKQFYLNLCGGNAVLADEDDVSRAECVRVIKRAIARLTPERVGDTTLRLPEKLQMAVQETVQEMNCMRESLEESFDSVARVEKDLKTIVTAAESALHVLRGDLSLGGGVTVDSGAIRPSVSYVARALVSEATDTALKLHGLHRICVDCGSILAQARNRDADDFGSRLEASLTSMVSNVTDELVLVGHCRELVAELLSLRTQRRSSLTVMERSAVDHEQLLFSVRGCVNTLLSSLDEVTPEQDDGNVDVAEVCEKLDLASRKVVRRLREKERVLSTSAKVLQDALLPGDEERSEYDTEGLLPIAIHASRALESGRVELENMRKALEHAQRQREESRRRMDCGAAEYDAKMMAQTQAQSLMEAQLSEATERQLQATANGAKLRRALSEFAGSVAAILLYKEGDTEEGKVEEGKDGAGEKTKDEVTDVVSRERLEDILEHCSAVMRALEAAKAKVKSLSSEAEDLREKLREHENASLELEYRSGEAERKAAASAAQLTEEVNCLRNALEVKTTECEKMQQQVHDTERRMDRLQAEIAGTTKSHGSERDELSKVQLSLVSENEEMRRQLEELRETLRLEQGELRKFLCDCQVTSLSHAATKISSLSADVMLTNLLREEAEHRAQLLHNWLLSYPGSTAPFLAICSRLATVMSETEFEDLPMRVAELLKREQEFAHLLGVPTKTPGPTRAALLKTVKAFAEKFAVNEEVNSEKFIAELENAITNLHDDSDVLRKKVAVLQSDLQRTESALETCSRYVEQISGLLRGVHQTEEQTVDPVVTATAAAAGGEGEGRSTALTLQMGIIALRSEVEWVLEKVISQAEQMRKALEVLEPVRNGRSVLEACVRTVEELKEKRATEALLRADLAMERANVDSCRSCIEASLRALPDSLIPVKTEDDLQQRCAAAAAELRRLKGILSSVQELIASSGNDDHNGDLCMNVDDMLRKMLEGAERVKVLEANCERNQQRALNLEKTLQAAEERMEDTITSRGEAVRKIMAEEKEKQNTLREQLTEAIHENDRLSSIISACGKSVGCKPKGGAEENSGNRNDNKWGEEVVLAVKVLATTHDAQTRELAELKEQLESLRKEHTSEKELRSHAQEEESRLAEEVKLLLSENKQATLSDEEHRSLLLHLTEEVEGSVLKLLLDEPTSHSPLSSTLKSRASLVAQRLREACDVSEGRRHDLENEVQALKKSKKEYQRELEEVTQLLEEDAELIVENATGNAKHLCEVIREKLLEMLKERKNLTDAANALQNEKATLASSLTTTAAQLEDKTASLEQLRSQKCVLDEELSALKKFAENIAKAIDEPLPTDSSDMEILTNACIASQTSLQEKTAEVELLRKELNAADRRCSAMEATIDENTTERGQLVERLRQVEEERDKVLKASDNTVARVQRILDDHVDVQREMVFTGVNDDDVTMADIVQVCVERLEQSRLEAATLNDQLTTLQEEHAVLMTELQRLENNAAVTGEEIAKLREKLRILLDSQQTSQIEQSKLSAEYDSLSRQLQVLFTDALHMAADDMKLRLPLLTDTSASGALQGLRSLLEYIAEKFRSGAIRTDDTDDKIEALQRLLQEQERQYNKEARNLYRTFIEHIANYTGTGSLKEESTKDDSHNNNSEYDDSDGKNTATNRKQRRLKPEALVSAGESIHRAHSDIRRLGKSCRRLVGIPVEASGQLRGMTLQEATQWLGEGVNAILEKAELLNNAIQNVSYIVDIAPIDFLSPQERVQEWVNSFGMWLERAQRGSDACEQLLEALTNIVHSHGGVVEEILTPSTTMMTSFNNDINNHPRHNMFDNSLQDLNNSHTDTSLSRYITDPHQRAVFIAVQDLISQLESNGRVLTSQWQALMDQNKRLVDERREAAEEQENVQSRVQELRRVVQRKIEEDRRVEQSLRELDRHLDMQARELAMKYCSDHDNIVRQFTELRGTIRRTLKPSQSHSPQAIEDLHSFLTPYIQDVWGGKTLFQFRQEHNRVEEAPASTAAEQMNHQLRADEESGRAAQQTAEKTHLSFKERAAKAMRERAAQMTFLKTLEGCYESVYNAKWHHIVETPGGGEGIGMEVKQGKPQKSWTYKKCISFEVGDEADQFSAPRCRLMVLTSEKGWPYSWFFSNVIPDCYVNYEVERVWQVIQADLTGKFDKKNNEESRVLRRVLIGTPGIGKGMAAGSYLLYQLLHCNATRLDVVVYGFGNVAFVFDKITKTVRSYKTFDEAKRHLEGMSARGMSGHIIYVLAPEEGEYDWEDLMPSFEWGMTAVSPPVRKCYHYFEEDMNALKIVMNCPTENDMKAMCAWMKRHQCEAAQAAHWSTIKSHITHIGPIPRDVFGREYAHQRLSDVQVAINGMDFSTCEGYGELKRFLYRPDRHPYGELMKYFRRNTDRGMEVDKFTSLSVPVRAKILACLARTIKSPDCRHPLLDETDRVFSTYLEVYGVCTFVYDRFVENIHKKIVALPPPTGCEPRHCVLRVDPQLCPRVPTALLPKWFHQRKSVVSHGVLYIQGVEEHPLFDAFFFVDSPRKTIVGLRTERAEPHNNNNITACAVKQFKECLAEYFKDWEEFAQDLSWEMIHVQDANSPSTNERDICTTTRCANETPREEKEEEEDATVEFWDRKVYQHTLKIEREDVAAIHRQ